MYISSTDRYTTKIDNDHNFVHIHKEINKQNKLWQTYHLEKPSNSMLLPRSISIIETPMISIFSSASCPLSSVHHHCYVERSWYANLQTLIYTKNCNQAHWNEAKNPATRLSEYMYIHRMGTPCSDRTTSQLESSFFTFPTYQIALRESNRLSPYRSLLGRLCKKQQTTLGSLLKETAFSWT